MTGKKCVARKRGYSRSEWWTRERVTAGLRRYARDFGEVATSGETYAGRLRAAGVERGRYPPPRAVFRWWATFSEASRAAGFDVRVRKARGPNRRPKQEHQAGERRGRLTVLGFAGYRQRARDRVALWRCRCECGEEIVLPAKKLMRREECEPCASLRNVEGIGYTVGRKLLKLDSDQAWENLAAHALFALGEQAGTLERHALLGRFRREFRRTLAEWRRELERQGQEPPPERPRLPPAARAKKKAVTYNKGE